LKIVDTDNINSGFLPEIYYGILGFLSNTLSPMIILVFVIFFVLIILAIAMIVKNVFKKVGDMSR
jgi:ABC-type siderophore export system fused ATPase/permease subunit